MNIKKCFKAGSMVTLLLFSIFSSIIIADKYETQDTPACTSSGYEYGNWSFSEHVSDGTLDETWNEENDTVWYPYSFGYPETYNPITNMEGDGSVDYGATMFIGDNIGDTLVHSEFNFTPNVTGTLYGINLHINHTLSTGSYPQDFDIYIDSGGIDQTIDGTKVKDAWNPSWTTGWKQVYFDTNYSVTSGTTYEIQFQTMETDNEDDFDRLYIGKDDNASGYNMTVYGGSSWDNYSYVGEIVYNITVEGNSTVYQFDANASTHSYTIMNSTGCNRSQLLGFVNLTYTSEPINYIYPYIIFAYHNNSDFDAIIFYDSFATFAHWDGEFFYNLSNQDQLMGDPFNLENYWDFQYEEHTYIESDGAWFKMIYNELSGELLFKKWSPFMQEPAGWAVQAELNNLSHEDCRCLGIGVWNEASESGVVNWDYLNLWQLNYTTNSSDYCNISGYNESRPHMDFPTINLSNYANYSGYLEGEDTENVSIDAHKDIMKMLTNKMNLESRFFIPYNLVGGDQIDNIYYYSCIYDSMKDYYNQTYGLPAPDWLYDEYLHLHIQMCPDKRINNTEYEDCIVAIDIDNNRQWDVNDRIFYAYSDGGWYNVSRYQHNGETLLDSANFNASIWQSDESAVGNLHRYTSYMNYAFNIPLVELVKSDLNITSLNDVFGLNIMTTMEYDGSCAVWQNWNETIGGPQYPEYNLTDELLYFMNVTWEEGYLNTHTNSTSLERWGEGEIVLGESFNQTDEIEYYVGTEKVANVTKINDITIDNLVNYTITVTQLSSGSATHIKINETLPDGIEYVSSSLPDEDVTNPYGNTYIFNVTDVLNVEEEFDFTVNFTAGCLPNGTNYTNTVYQYNDQNANSTASDNITYGTNHAPEVNWTYPDNESTSVSLLLANISALVYDEDGDNMDIYFFTNKTSSWTASWNAIGENLTQTNGVYMCNQTFNLSGEYNTRWRWGNTTYYWSINITDGKIWVNNTYHYTTDFSRYNVDAYTDYKVNAIDLSRTWAHRTVEGHSSYIGLYDMNADGTIVNVIDLGRIWANRLL